MTHGDSVIRVVERDSLREFRGKPKLLMTRKYYGDHVQS
jgi:hypothetical protein